MKSMRPNPITTFYAGMCPALRCAVFALRFGVDEFYRWVKSKGVSGAMKTYKSLILAAAVLLCMNACRVDKFKPGSGDIGRLILQKAVAAGATPVSTNVLLRLSGSWRYFEDDKGIVILMAPFDYPVLESFLIQTFGQPKLGPEDTPSGGKFGVYRLTTKGGVLQFGRTADDGTHLSIIRPLTRQEFGDAVGKALADPEFHKALPKQ